MQKNKVFLRSISAKKMNEHQDNSINQILQNVVPFEKLYKTKLNDAINEFTVRRNILVRKSFFQMLLSVAGVIAGTIFLSYGLKMAGYSGSISIMFFTFLSVLLFTFITNKIFKNSMMDTVRAVLVIGYFGLLVAGFILMAKVQNEHKFFTLYHFSFMFSLFVVGVLFSKSIIKLIERYRKDYREIILQKLVNGFDEDIIYTPEIGITEEEYNYAEFPDYKRSNRKNYKFISHNLIEQYECKPQFKCSTIGVTPLIIIFTNKELKGTTIIKPNLGQHAITKAITKLNMLMEGDDPLVEIDHPEFNEYFRAHSNYPDETKEILTPDFLNRLVAIQEKLMPESLKSMASSYNLGVQFSLSIKNEVIYIFPNFQEGERVIGAATMFKLPNFWRSTNYKKRLEKDYMYLHNIYEIVNELKFE